MCIIAAKPAGVEMPSAETIKNMWTRNPDGAGFMWAEDGKIHIRKGFMKFKDFDTALNELTRTHDMTATALVMHFRIATHGGVVPGNCHPFPISDSVGMLGKLDCKCRLGVAHNGIINSVFPRKGISDTMEYIASQLAPLHRAVPNFYKDKNLMEMVYNAVTSKLAFLTEKGDIYTVGDFVKDNGIMYSNTSYQCSYFSNGWRSFKYSSFSLDNTPSVYDTDWYNYDTIAEEDGYYTDAEVMWLTEDDYVMSGGELYSEAESGGLAMDVYGTVYEYDVKRDALVEWPCAQAFNSCGIPLKFDETSANTLTELVFSEYTTYTEKK